MTNIKFLNFILTVYVFSTIIFNNSNYLFLLYFTNVLLLSYYILLILNRTKGINNIYYDKVLILYFIFSLFCLSSSFWSPNFEISFKHSLTMLLLSINMFLIYNSMQILKSATPIFNGIILAILVNFVLLLFGNHNALFDNGAFTGTLDQSNTMSLVLLFSIFVSLYYINTTGKNSYKIINLINIGISSYLILLTVSKKGLLGLSLMLIIQAYIFFKKDKFLLRTFMTMKFFIPLLIFLIYFIDFENLVKVFENSMHRFILFIEYMNTGVSGKEGSTEERIHFLYLAQEMFFNNIFIGEGIRSFVITYGTYSHNNYMELLANVGVVGFGIFYSIYVILLKRLFYFRNPEIKINLLLLLILLLFIDFTIVTYYSKFVLLMIVVIVWLIHNPEEKYFEY